MNRLARSMTVWLCLLTLLGIGLRVPSASAEVRVSSLFNNDMVFQRNMPLKIWGTATPGEKVEVQLGDHKGSADTDEFGNWMVTLSSLKEGKKPAPDDLGEEHAHVYQYRHGGSVGLFRAVQHGTGALGISGPRGRIEGQLSGYPGDSPTAPDFRRSASRCGREPGPYVHRRRRAVARQWPFTSPARSTRNWVFRWG